MESKDYIKSLSDTAERRFFSSEVRAEKRDDALEGTASVI